MADQYQVKLIGGGEILLFEITPAIDYEILRKVSEAGVLDAADVTVPLHGFIRGDNANDTFDKWLTLFNFALNHTLVDMEIILNGTIVQQFRKNSNTGSPFIQNLATIPQGGSLVNMVEFTLDVVVRRTGENKIGSGLRNVTRESMTDWYNERLQRKEWIIRATGENAREQLLALKPDSIKPIFVSEMRKVDDNSYEIHYVFEETHTTDLLRWDESIVVEGGGIPLIPVYRTDRASPIIELGRRREFLITVTGTLFSYKKPIPLVSPPPVIPRRFLDPTRGMFSPTTVDDPIRATYRREYRFVFVVPAISPALAIFEPRNKVRDPNFPSAVPDSEVGGF